MPELPEVELVVRDLQSILFSEKDTSTMPVLTDILLTCPTLCKDKEDLVLLKGDSCSSIRRYGKYILFTFQSGKGLLCHLKMTGRFEIFDSSQDARFPYERARLIFQKKHQQKVLIFSDVRRFGRFSYIPSCDEVCLNLGPEPFEIDFATKIFHNTRKKNGPIKSLLLDQSLVAGIGNIYADESLFSAGISPFRPASHISLQEYEKLQAALVEIMSMSIVKGGSSLGAHLGNFSSPYGLQGKNQETFSVYHQTGKACKKCGSTIQKRVLRGRSTHYCPRCQKV